MRLNKTFDVSINNQTNYVNGVYAIGSSLLSVDSWDYYIRIFNISSGLLAYVFNSTNGGHTYYIWTQAPIGTRFLGNNFVLKKC